MKQPAVEPPSGEYAAAEQDEKVRFNSQISQGRVDPWAKGI